MFKVEKISEDKRGEIYRIVSGRIYWWSYTRKGFGRGGDIHDCRQHNYVMEGGFLVKMKFPTEEVERVVLKGHSIIIPENIPHVFIALEDSVMLEWHSEKLPPYKQKRFYKPYRRLCK